MATTAELRLAIENGQQVFPVFGPVDQKPVKYDPRTKYDPQPWNNGTYRYNSRELEIKRRDPMSYQRWLKSEAANVGEVYADTRSKHAGGVA